MEKRIEKKVKDNAAVVVKNALVEMPHVNFNGDLGSGFVNIQIDQEVMVKFDGTKGKFVNVSIYSILSALKSVVRPSIYHYFQEHPKEMEDVLWKSKMDFLIEPLKKGDVHVNLFTDEKDDAPVKIDCVHVDVINVSLSADGEKEIKDLKLRMMLAR